MKRYEGMFLFDAAVTREWASVEEEVRRVCDRIGAELLVCVKFDERKLAYEIERRKRGTYVLTYFDAPPERIADLERDVGLSELILRALVLRADTLTEERLAELKAHPAETPMAPLAGDGRRHDDERRGDYRRGGGKEREPDRKPVAKTADVSAEQPVPATEPVEPPAAEPPAAEASPPRPAPEPQTPVAPATPEPEAPASPPTE